MSNATTLSDVEVTLDVLNPAVPINLGILAIFTPGEADKVHTYLTQEDALAEITDDKVKAIASGYYAQANHASKLLVITYTDLTAAVEAHAGDGWEFATLTGTAVKDSDYTAIANYIEGRGKQFFIKGVPANADTVSKATDIAKQFFGNKRTILFATGAADGDETFGVGALIGALANLVVGSITWKFKELSGVNPADLNAAQVKTLRQAGIITYVSKAGQPQTSDGITVGGQYIDNLHGDDWVKASVETALQKLLFTTDKLTFDAKGIAQIDAVITGVLLQATANEIILVDTDSGAGKYTVTTTSRAAATDAEIEGRHYTGASFEYTRSGAIHDMVVHGTVAL